MQCSHSFRPACWIQTALCLTRYTVSNPPMYTMAKMMGIRNLPDFADMAAITFVDVIVSHDNFTDALLFHELVHVVQYSQMDMKEFSTRFIQGFIQGGSYEKIPLEMHARALEDRFSQGGGPFSVDDEVRQWREANVT